MRVARPIGKGISPERRRTGYTLVETLVAAAILAIVIMSTIAVVRKGRELDITDRHRRVARAIITAEFELPKYDCSGYRNLIDGTTTRQVVIDPHNGSVGNTLKGTLTVMVRQGTATFGAAGTIPYRAVYITVHWLEPQGTETVSIKKRIAEGC
jgi:prepilin-type N-terminal cleavage/methylation domain-containing protein